jgi:hypothetical protein
MIIENAFWNGEPCFAKAVKVIVGKSPRETWWCAALAGKEHSAIEISQGAERFYINDDADGREKNHYRFWTAAMEPFVAAR